MVLSAGPVHKLQHCVRGHYEGTAAWFFEGTIFKDWISIGSLLWIHGKRKLLLSFDAQNLMGSDLHSGVWEEHPLVRHFPTIVVND